MVDVRGRGFLIGMEFRDDALGYEVAKALFRRRILVGGTLNNSRVIRIEPPYCISEEQINAVLDGVNSALKELS
jgi:putrescine aminotransferase